MSKTFSDYISSFFEELSPDLNSIYAETADTTVSNFEFWTITKSTVSGGLLAAIPIAGYATIPADFLYLMRLMTVISYGIGAIMGREKYGENILEHEDFAMIIARWSGESSVQDAALAKLSSDLATKFAGREVAKLLAKHAVKYSGIMVGKSLGGQAGAKVGAKLGAKLGAKVATRWIPVVSAVVGGGVNLIILNQIANAAESWFKYKLSNHS